MLARRKMSVGELADRAGNTPANLAILKNGRAKAVRFATLAALCEELECQPGNVLRLGGRGRRRRRTCSRAGMESLAHRPVTRT
jgi:putative transcriptional regulator